ncbi:hypothetical protein HMN09_01307400 [Mycena chlorophos]|uniref:Protein SQS1 n=1 Tax=Mycena chlorophos TaxID=658473 RepID=A0A8H6VQI9_MYCCL|nr:hypothetical protein HMN09_01307400 [Mycena chlorophos]
MPVDLASLGFGSPLAPTPATPERGRGRGRGRGGWRGRARGALPAYDLSAERGAMMQMYPDYTTGVPLPARSAPSPYAYDGRGRGRGIGSPQRGRGRGGFGRHNPDAPLSKLLDETRPLLKPIVFVRSVYTATLFETEEELMQPLVEDVGDDEQQHVPTAERVARVFSGARPPTGLFPDEDGDDDDDEELEEFDFSELAQVQAEVDALAASAAAAAGASGQQPPEVEIVEEKFTGMWVDKPIRDAQPVVVLDIETTTTSTVEDTQTVFAIDTDSTASTTNAVSEMSTTMVDEASLAQAPVVRLPTSAVLVPVVHTPEPQPQHDQTLFFVDTTPTPVPASDAPEPGAEESLAHALHRHAGEEELEAEPDEVIVYVAPHPKNTTRSPSPSIVVPSLPADDTSVLTGTTIPSVETPAPTPTLVPPTFSSISFVTLSSAPSPAPSPSPRKPAPTALLTAHGRTKTKLKARVVGKRAKRRAGAFTGFGGGFGSRGAALEEARLHEDARGRGTYEGSDIDWGDEDEDDDFEAPDAGHVPARGDAEDPDMGMQVDPDLDAGALARFAKGLLDPEGSGSKWVTMDDVADGVKMAEEDADEQAVARGESGHESSEGDEEVEKVFEKEEVVMLGEGDSDDDDEEDDDDDEEEEEDIDHSPKSAFQMRLERMRKAAKGKARDTGRDDSLDEIFWDVGDDEEEEDDEEDLWDVYEKSWRKTRKEEDDDFEAELQAILDEDGEVIASTSRRGRKALLKAAVENQHRGGIDLDDWDMDLDFSRPAKRGKKKRADIPGELQDIWDRDRAKKAENKQLRALAKLAAAADPLAQHKGGKKGRKAMLAAARLDPSSTITPNRVIDLTTLVVRIRAFVNELGAPQSMALPPTDKATRKATHELALCFGLKSVSKGKGAARYTTLTKTTRTGVGAVDERKVEKIVRRGSARGHEYQFVNAGRGAKTAKGENLNGNGKGRGGGGGAPRHRDGDEVGKAAPKIGEGNIGFRMLASMGWSEGQRIGAGAQGLSVPLTAVIKNTKAGLGAGR